MKISEEDMNMLDLRQTTIKEKACTNCDGDVMTKWKYGAPDIACMRCGFDYDDMVKQNPPPSEE